ncbi:MarR family winged helix-turn-helix transcriptional regulator [Thermophilibacter provencensis]|uniref:MarR family transcriptional regulator n=1 Tax=Thermophilibacter provencensis TaxID=1852386 RepID=A0ABT7V5B1_9ACTN|nr:MarR family transcriptional regulator [Thermophilibacter provencensis]MDM8271161.1 MarR family transcriptional regulator [Thermophilibacter provencensis]
MCEKGDTPSRETRIMRNFGYFGYYLHMHWGGRNGKQHILVELLAHDGEMTQRDLQEASCITSASLSEVIAKLEAEGLVSRERSETDRRQLTVTLTPEGEHKAREVVRTRAEFEERAFDCLTEDEKSELVDVLDRIAANWAQLEKDKKGDER